jgi:hypothetical protein
MIADAVRRFLLRLSVEGAQQAKAEINQLGEQGDRAFQRITSGAQGASRALSLLGPVLSGLSAGALVTFTKRAIDAVGGFGELADQAGVSTDALQAFQFVAAQSGISSEQMQRGLEALTRRIGDAAAGQGDATKEFQRFGIAVVDSAGRLRATEAVLADVADAVAATKDPLERAAIATAAFGDRFGQKLIPLLAEGRDRLKEYIEQAIALGVVIDTTLIGQANEASDKLAALGEAFKSLGRTLAVEAAPPLIAFANALERIIKGPSLSDQRAFWASEIERLESAVRDAQERLAKARTLADQEQFGSSLRSLQRQLETAKRLLAQVEQQQQAAQERAERILNPDRSMAARPRPVPSGPSPEEARLEALRRQLDLLMIGNDRARFIEERAAGFMGAQREEAERLAAALFDLQQVRREENQALTETSRLYDETRTPLEKYIEALERLGELRPLLELRFGIEGASEIISRRAEALVDILNKAENQTGKVDDVTRQLGFTFQSAFEDAIVRGRKLSEVLQGLAMDVARIFIRRSITEPLAATFSSFIGGIFGGAKSAKGNVFDKGDLVPFARGGVVDRPTVFPFARGIGLMGEAGPEAIMPLARDSQGRLGVRARESGPIINQTINVNVSGGGAGDVTEQQRLAREIGRLTRAGVIAAIQEQQRAGGMLRASPQVV